MALFLVLSGGTALATHPGGANTISSDDIINKEIRTADIRDNNVQTPNLGPNAVTSPKIADGEVRSVDVLDNSLTAEDIADVGFLRAKTVNLIDTDPGGGGDFGPLLTIGRVTLGASCQNLGAGSLRAAITTSAPDAPPRPLLVIGSETFELGDPMSPQPLLSFDNTAYRGKETSFAILDRLGTSANGVAGVSVEPSTGRCLASAQATG